MPQPLKPLCGKFEMWNKNPVPGLKAAYEARVQQFRVLEQEPGDVTDGPSSAGLRMPYPKQALVDVHEPMDASGNPADGNS